MSRLQTELNRLYLAPCPDGLVRAAVLALARPADWAGLSAVWRGVQSDLALPAPAIAVSGRDAYQLWFSFAAPQAQAEAQAFLDLLRRRYLAEFAQERVASAPPGALPALPPQQVDVQQDLWSAFVAPDLAPVFAAEPWLDIAPNIEGQADLLCRLGSIHNADLCAAMASLAASTPALSALSAHPADPAARSDAASTAGQGAIHLGPEQFLRQVINDATVAMALRIEAAKALLQAKK